MFIQRKFIKEQPEEASAQREMFSNMRKWVKTTFPSGITEDEWDAVLTEEDDMLRVHVY